MTLTKEDIHRLELVGYSKNEFIRQVDGFTLLTNTDGHCVFLDPQTNKCKVYETRPLGCRLYPLILSIKENEVVIDSEYCPYGYMITPEQIKTFEKDVRNFIRQVFAERV